MALPENRVTQKALTFSRPLEQPLLGVTEKALIVLASLPAVTQKALGSLEAKGWAGPDQSRAGQGPG